jgi:hypothetical protein
LAAALLGVWPAGAEEPPPLGQLTPYLRLTGELRARVEFNNFFRPEPAVNNDNEYVFGATRTRLGVGLTTTWVDAFVQAEHTGLYGLPDDAVAVPGGALGTGALYFAEDPHTDQSDLHLKQAYLTLKPALLHAPGLSLTLGRFEILDGLEYRTGDAKFDLLKTVRISQRLLGPFDFAHATRSFDGGKVAWDHRALNVTASASHPTQGGFNIDAQDTIDDIDLVYAAVTGKRGSLLPGTEGRIFYLYYADDRRVQVVDNRAAAQRPFLDTQDLSIHNVGGHFLATHALGPGVADGLVWADYQFGDWTSLDHRAWAVAAEAGYQWTRLPAQPWFRVGYFRGSGDHDPNDRTHETFFNVLPTARIYANSPFYNLMNIGDAFAQLILVPIPSMRFRMDYHMLALSESADLWYAGSGAQRQSSAFGYAGRRSSGAQSLADVIEAGLSHTVNRYFSWNVYYGHAFGGGVVRRFFRGQDDADYAFAEFTAKF